MKLWIDDLRDCPDSSWVWFKDSASALRRIALRHDDILEISFDHDLGGDDTSIKVANEIERLVYEGLMDMPEWHVHSANPVGRANLTRIMHSAERFARRLADDSSTHDTARSDARECEIDAAGDNPSETNHGDRSTQPLQAYAVLQASTANSVG